MFCFAETSAKIDLQLLETDEVIRVTLRDKPVLEYVKKENPVPEGMPEHFRRSGYIHPVYSPKGQEVTGDFLSTIRTSTHFSLLGRALNSTVKR